ncbi:hypothetical protein M9Y10_010148 [Tritrichomonas musculus]|uniref:Uncharacterized protein n=1 Tax=Tritrichomonas musculus TaxID=1915356 RepID=A0ABR2IQK0_9EUKA
MQKAIHYFNCAANHNEQDAHFFLGFNIDKAIHYFKIASCFYNQYAKNNLGVIYKTGKGVTENVYRAIEYFEEAILEKMNPFRCLINTMKLKMVILIDQLYC